MWPRERPAQAVRAAAVEVAHELPVDHVRPVLARVAAEAPAVPGAPPRGAIVYLVLTVRPRERPPQAVRTAAVEVAHELPVDHVRPVLARVAAEAAPPEAEGRIQGDVGQ